METKKRWKFPVPSGGHIGKVQFIHKVTDVLMCFDYLDDDDKAFHGGISFKTIYAYKNATEMFYDYTLKGTYDTLVEYTNSEWLKKLAEKNPESAQLLKIRHFAIYLEDYGLYEVIASDFKILEIKEGPLKA